ncbi:MAG: kelch repeat-containing protein [Chitinophagaceae bacterium]
MKTLFFYIYSLIMFSTVEATAQRDALCRVEWKVAGSLPSASNGQKSPGVAGPVTGIHNGILIVAGGANFPDAMPWLGGKKKYTDEGFVFKIDPRGGTTLFSSFKLDLPLAYSANCSTPDGIISAGGENEQGISSNVFLFQCDGSTGNVVTKYLPDLPVALTNAAITFIDGKAYVAGGETKAGVSDRVFVLDPENASAGWENLPSLPQAVSHTVMVANTSGNGHSIYVLGGRKKNSNGISDLYTSVYQLDIATGQWKKKSDLPYALTAGTGILAADNTILLFGGDDGATFHRVEELIATIAGETDSLRKQELNEKKIRLLSAHPGFHKAVLSYNINTGEWKTIGTIPFNVPVTTTAIGWNNHVIIPGGEIKAGVRTPDILLGKFVFESTRYQKKKNIQ